MYINYAGMTPFREGSLVYIKTGVATLPIYLQGMENIPCEVRYPAGSLGDSYLVLHPKYSPVLSDIVIPTSEGVYLTPITEEPLPQWIKVGVPVVYSRPVPASKRKVSWVVDTIAYGSDSDVSYTGGWEVFLTDSETGGKAGWMSPEDLVPATQQLPPPAVHIVVRCAPVSGAYEADGSRVERIEIKPGDDIRVRFDGKELILDKL